MARSGLSRAQDQIHILLKFPLEQQLGAETVAALESTERKVRREAFRRIEAHEPDFRPHAEDVVRRICARVSAKAPTMAVASEESGLHFLSIDDFDPNVGPPEGVPVYNPYTGVLSVYPEQNLEPDEAVAGIREAVKSDDAVEGVERVVIYRAISAFDTTLQTEPESDGYGYDYSEMAGLDARRHQAALQTALAGESVPWGIDQIGARAAWRRGYAGQGVVVAVVDTGISPHVDLALPVRGATFVPGSISYTDDHGHGTHVAGTIAARRSNGLGVVGVAPQARLMAVKVLARDGYSRGDSVALGITWAANNGAQVINLSLGSGQASDSLRRAVIYARSRQVIVCAAAGNDYGGAVSYPAAFDDACIAVAATDQSNRRANFSNRGSQLDLSAPGVGIESTYLANTYRELNGTSMATPHVAGVAAILLSRYPGLSPLMAQRHLEATAMPLGAPDLYGRGLVHAERAVATQPQPVVSPAVAVVVAPAAESDHEVATPAAAAGRSAASKRGHNSSR
ncbi:S8 family peptidase [Mesorhizobium sp. M0862]|uniref:S8 family peptidase n=1 Tax=Mesorhizobium sp. M0862 TaxID=2957015 RepID=UPI003339ED6C